MKTLHLVITAVFLITVTVFLSGSQYANASTCSVKETTLTTPQFYRVSDSVFVGIISSIDNYTDDQWKIQFNAEKIWKGEKNPTITLIAGSLQACGYSLVNGEKYLVFASGSPSYLIPQTTQPYADAQYAISLYDDPQFQAEETAKENLNKKLEAAKDIITSMMINHNTSNIPFNMVGVDVLNATLDVGIDSTKATLSKEEYQKKIKDIVGDIPMNIEMGVINLTGGASTNNVTKNDSLSSLPLSPLKQFKSGITLKEVKCEHDLQLVIRAEDNSPACVKPDTAQKLIERGWAKEIVSNTSGNSVTKTLYSGIDKPSGIILLGNQTYYITTFNGILDSIPSNGTEISSHGVLFTLLRPVASTANGYLYVVDVRFTSDNTNESLVIYPVGVGAVQADKVLSKHIHPQAGFIVYQYNTIKLLVSTENQTTGSTASLNQVVSVVAIKMIPPYTPGGPVVQLTLKNISMKYITSLNATLETNWNYTFNFQNVTSSTPLISGNSTSDTRMLIGGGFETELSYPLIISGIADNVPFRYSVSVNIS